MRVLSYMLTLIVAALAVAWLDPLPSVAALRPVAASVAPLVASVAVESPELVAPVVVLAEAVRDEVRETDLAIRLTDAALEWSPIKNHVRWGESEIDARLRIANIASRIARVTTDPIEPSLPAYAARTSPRSRTAFFMLAQADIESDLAAYVDDGRCNDATWRGSAEAKRIMHGDCDHSITPTGAWTIWQIHVNEQGGVVLTPEGWLSPDMARRKRVDAPIVRGRETIADPLLGARVALHWMRGTPTAWGSAPGARAKADAWLKKHPLPDWMP